VGLDPIFVQLLGVLVGGGPRRIRTFNLLIKSWPRVGLSYVSYAYQCGDIRTIRIISPIRLLHSFATGYPDPDKNILSRHNIDLYIYFFKTPSIPISRPKRPRSLKRSKSPYVAGVFEVNLVGLKGSRSP
jgi:hypothetical protein